MICQHSSLVRQSPCSARWAHLRIPFLFLIFCLGWSSWQPSLSKAQEQSLPAPDAATVVQAKNSDLVDHIIPSKSTDLFAVLKNGLTVLVREAHGSQVVSCQVLVKTGSIYEGDRIGGGLSHYLEHVVSGGTTSTISETQIKQKVQELGGATNAHTSYDDTVYFITTTKPNYQNALRLLINYVGDCQFEETAYKREKPIILEEFQLRDNDPDSQLWQLFMSTAYRVHPVRYPVIGDKNIFLKMNRNDLIAHYRRWYSPENMVISISGDVDKNEALSTVIELAGKMERAVNPPYLLPAEPRQLASQRVEKVAPIARLAKAIMGFRTISLTNSDLYALDLLAVIMGDGRTSRAYQALRQKTDLVFSVSVNSWTPPFADGQFMINMDLSYDNLSLAIDKVWDELRKVQTDLVSKEELARAKNKVKAEHVFEREPAENLASQSASDWASTGDPYFSDKYVAEMDKVTAEQIKDVARKYFQEEQMTLAVIRPPFTETSQQVQSPAELTTDLAKVPANISDKKICKQVLSDQMTLLVKRNTAAPVVSLVFVAKAGLRYEPLKSTGISRFMASLLTKGTATRSKLEIAQIIEDLGGSINSGAGQDTIVVSASVLKEHFDKALEVLADVVLHPAFPDMEIEKQRKDTLLAIEKLDEEWSTEVTRLFERHYYRNHPYRNDIIGTKESISGLSRQDIVKFYNSVIAPNNSVLAVFGDIDPASVVSRVTQKFQDFQPSILELPLIEQETQNITMDEAFETTNEKTSAAILVGYNGLTINDPDVPTVQVLDAVTSGIWYPSGWLHDALRGGDQSLVYYVHAYPVFGVDAGYFGVMTQVSPVNYDKALQIVFEQINRTTQKELDPQTLYLGKKMCKTIHELRLETNGAQASSAAINELMGLGFDYDARYPELIEKVTAQDTLRVAKKLFSNHLVVATKPAAAPAATPAPARQ